MPSIEEQLLSQWNVYRGDIKERTTNDDQVRSELMAFGLPITSEFVILFVSATKRGPMLQYTLTFRGMLTLMLRASDVVDIFVGLVHKNDSYKMNQDGTLTHDYDPFDEKRVIQSPEDIRGGYMVVTYHDGRRRYHFVPVWKMTKARSCAKKRNIWDSWFEEMCYKTVVRNAFARCVITVDPIVQSAMVRALRAEDEALENDPTAPSESVPVWERFANHIASCQSHEELAGVALEVKNADIPEEHRRVLRGLYTDRRRALDGRTKTQTGTTAKGPERTETTETETPTGTTTETWTTEES